MVKLTLQIPDDVYAPLAERAKQDGKTPEEVALGYVSNGVTPLKDDPLLALFGSISTDIPNVSDNHDKYIGEALYKEMHGDG